jgi:hypothetical protein
MSVPRSGTLPFASARIRLVMSQQCCVRGRQAWMPVMPPLRARDGVLPFMFKTRKKRKNPRFSHVLDRRDAIVAARSGMRRRIDRSTCRLSNP